VKRPLLLTGDIFRQQPRGGITRYFLELKERLPRPVTMKAGLHMSEELGFGRIPAVRGAHRLVAWANAGLDALLFARSGDKAIVHPTYYRDPRALPRRAPVVATVFDMTHERFPGLFQGARDPARHKAALCRRADRVLCISEATRHDVLERLGLPEANVRATPLAGRDWSRVTAEPLAGEDGPFLLWVGERHAYKNFLPSVTAWARCDEARGTRLLCAGGAPFGADELRAFDSLGVRDRVRRRVLSEGALRWAYERALALVYTSRWEGFGLPLVEAFGLGCAVLASDIAPLREAGGETAVYADPDNPEALRAGLGLCLATARDPQAVAARHAQAARFSWDTCAAQHEAVYQELD
jgi:glycosyltransferase involved in cell wall biosynthesis